MASFQIHIDYLITGSDANATVAMSSASLSPDTGMPADDKSKTAIFANGDISIDKGDTADITYALGNDDTRLLSLVQIKSTDEREFGGELDDDEAADFPDFSRSNGSYNPGTEKTSARVHDGNSKAKDVDYRVRFTNSANGAIIYSDPRIRDSGGRN